MRTTAVIASTLLLALVGCAMDDLDTETEVQEAHSWGDYHWARTTNSFTLPTLESLTPDWEGYLDAAVTDWNDSTVLNFVVVADDDSTKVRRRCNAPDGHVRVCNLAYGQTGWLGIAGISLDSNNHIVRGYTKLNDTYFASSFYNTDEWKQMVVCQEIGHDIGLGHQDEDFNNASLFTCMDYQDPPFPKPNAHDFEQLEDIYAHTDSYDSYGGSSGGGDGGGGGCNAPEGKGCNKADTWGVSMGRNGNTEYFSRPNPDGTTEITAVLWAE